MPRFEARRIPPNVPAKGSVRLGSPDETIRSDCDHGERELCLVEL